MFGAFCSDNRYTPSNTVATVVVASLCFYSFIYILLTPTHILLIFCLRLALALSPSQIYHCHDDAMLAELLCWNSALFSLVKCC